MAVAFTQLPPLVLVDLRFTSFLERTHTLLLCVFMPGFPGFFSYNQIKLTVGAQASVN